MLIKSALECSYTMHSNNTPLLLLHDDVLLHTITNFLSGYNISKMSLVSKYYRDTVKTQSTIIWSSVLTTNAMLLAKRFPYGFVPCTFWCTHSVYSCAYRICKHAVRKVRYELGRDFNLFRDSVEACKFIQDPSIFRVTQKKWDQFQYIFTAIPLCSRWNAIDICLNVSDLILYMHCVLHTIYDDEELRVHVISKRHNFELTNTVFMEQKYEFKRVIRRLLYVYKNIRFAMKIIER
jgi:hypothetical protein